MNLKFKYLFIAVVLSVAGSACTDEFDSDRYRDEGALPGIYFEMMLQGVAEAEEDFAGGLPDGLTSPPFTDREYHDAMRERPVWLRQSLNTMLAAATLYTRRHDANPRHGDPALLELAGRIGDFFATEGGKAPSVEMINSSHFSNGAYHRDLYMWMESYRLLEDELDPERRELWRQELERTFAELATHVDARTGVASFVSPFIRTSTNHFALWVSTLYLAGKVFDNRQWLDITEPMLHRFAVEQSPDGFWGEHDGINPTTGYNYLTVTAMALYWEHSQDPEALEALRRATDFHKYYTYPDGMGVEVINDRTRYNSIFLWGSFGFSNFPDGRSYAEFLAQVSRERQPRGEFLGRVAQNALYWHEGPYEIAAPQQQQAYSHQMEVPAGIRKAGPWVVALSGLINTQTPSRFYLDRQGHLGVFHEGAGLIITGANSKRQPEVATFREVTTDGRMFHRPTVGRLQMDDEHDRLSLAYITFTSDLFVDPPEDDELRFRFVIAPRTYREEAELNLQLMLEAGQTLETGSGQTVMLGEEPVELSPEDLGGLIRHRGWTMQVDSTARLSWPVYPYNPYDNGPETSLDRAIGVLTVPITIERAEGFEPMGVRTQEIPFVIRYD